jgi:hypothetical protein
VIDLSLEPRRAELRRLGFDLVRDRDDEIVAVRCKWHWDMAMRLSTIVRVRRQAHLANADVVGQQAALEQIADMVDPSVLPRGFQQGRQLIDIWLADTAEPAAQKYCADTVGKGMGLAWHPVCVTPEASTYAPMPIWGLALYAKNEHVMQRVGAMDGPTDEPIAKVGLGLALLVFYPTFLGLVAATCGLGALVPLGVWFFEKDKQPKLLDG